MSPLEKTAVFEGMANVIKALDYIAKQSSTGVSYQFRSIDALMNKLHGPLADNGLFLSPRVLDDWQVNQIPGKDNKVQTQVLFRVCVDVYAADGSFVTLGPGLAQSHDYGDKAAYQAQQNAIKYLLLEAFCIPTAEPDMDSREADPVEPFNVRAYAALETAQFAEWDEETRKKEWVAACQGMKPASSAEAETVIRIMRDRYDNREQGGTGGESET